jgi:hypothetical protein
MLKQKESDLAKTVFDYLQLAKPSALYFHVPNERNSSPRNMKFLKARGLLPGVADLIFMSGQGVSCIELKVSGNYQSPSQKEFQLRCFEHGVGYKVCRSVDEVRQVLVDWGLLTASAPYL